ncbi:UDP-N-acetylglucosamine 1-carboxyvinyltransferase [Caldanaerobius polysaccharolyticus]|uniref:UDP-N-acetylglucosamine 1-carboxyvinyltransferase n=1 Tax=Caldanaerobius polysaccharolyticus TaxID=44256 RepID=UPI00047E873B|nr:UDP-N-acetylglucosamine 1-carboxyvinyltransferase [Caldanaerobius polysaccharolyticus]
MARLLVEKSPPLKGRVKVSGAKNSVLPIMAASLMSEGTVTIKEIPELEDVVVMKDVLGAIGSKVQQEDKGVVEITTPAIWSCEAPNDLVKRMRASFLVMGPLLAKKGKARMYMPGGCNIGVRPVDLHLKGFSALGTEITQERGYIEAKAKKLRGATIYLDFPSVGATENIMMAACLAEGQTVIENAAEEPEIVDLANFLNKMGARIKGAGTDTIRIEGVKQLGSAEHTVIPDRIEVGTFMIAAAITGGDIIIDNVIMDHVVSITAKLKEAGIEVMPYGSSVRVKGKECFKATDVKTLPYPGFPTDMQAPFMALMSVAKGNSVIIETVFENRFLHVEELKRMGAKIKIEGRSAIVEGVPRLTGAQVKATDLRAGAALVLAGLVAEGVSEISDVFHIDRGYERFEEKLKGLGAIITRVQ